MGRIFWTRAITSWITLAGISIAGALCLRLAENNNLSVPFAGAIVAFIVLLLLTATRRVAFSIYLGWGIVALATAVSGIKYKMKGFSLHFYDAVVVAGDPEMYRFLLVSYPRLVLPVLLGLVLTIAAVVLVYRLDQPVRIPYRRRAALLAVSLFALPATFPAEAVQTRYFYYLQGRHVTAFFVSLLDIPNALGTSDLEAHLAGLPGVEPFKNEVDCGEGSRPDVFVVLAESQTDPSIFPQIEQGAAIAERMTAAAGRLRPLQVETFGGGTWISNLSLMTGLSATDFGWRSPYLTISLEGRVGGSLPEIFSRCGYRTAALLPLNYTFVNEGPFLHSIGFETVLDKDKIGATHYHLRDKFYFSAAEDFIAEHRKSDGRPLFFLIQTMFPHSPYEEVLEPDEQIGLGALHPNAETSEYLRRLIIASGDLSGFSGKMYPEAAGRPAVVVTFGDHQAFVTKPFVEDVEGANPLANPRSLAYRTYFSIKGRDGGDPAGEAPIDIPFLGNHVLRAAGIPGNPIFADLARLETLCGGRFHLCAVRGEVDLHLKRRVAGGQLGLSATQ